jgi:hypothetical protein
MGLYCPQTETLKMPVMSQGHRARRCPAQLGLGTGFAALARDS